MDEKIRTHWHCRCSPWPLECHCHDCLLAQRNEAREIARELLKDAEPDHWDESRMQKRYLWLKEPPGADDDPVGEETLPNAEKFVE